jgi:hypothetical protein
MRIAKISTAIILILFLISHLGVGPVRAVELPNDGCEPGPSVEAFAYNGDIAVSESEFGGATELTSYYTDPGLQEMLTVHSEGRIFVDSDNVVHAIDNGTDYSRQVHPSNRVDGIFCDVYDGDVDGENSVQETQTSSSTDSENDSQSSTQTTNTADGNQTTNQTQYLTKHPRLAVSAA